MGFVHQEVLHIFFWTEDDYVFFDNSFFEYIENLFWIESRKLHDKGQKLEILMF